MNCACIVTAVLNTFSFSLSMFHICLVNFCYNRNKIIVQVLSTRIYEQPFQRSQKYVCYKGANAHHIIGSSNKEDKSDRPE